VLATISVAFVLELHVGAEGVDAGADAVLLQVGGLVVERLRQSRGIGGLDVGGGRWLPRYCETTSRTLSSRTLTSCARTESTPSWLERYGATA